MTVPGTGPIAEVRNILDDIEAAGDVAKDYASTTFSTADTFIAALSAGLDNVTPPTITADFPDTPTAPAIQSATSPTLADVSVSFPSLPSAFSGDLSDITPFLPEPFDENPPELVLGTVPTFVGTVPGSPTVDYSITAPDFDGITLPAPPDLLTVSIRQFDGINIPTFSEEVPELAVVAPTIVAYDPGDPYSSALLAALQAALQDRIENGGTGLPPDVENAIWDRGREREAIATRDALAELDQFEARGFALPPGQYADAYLKITTEMAARTVTNSREVAIAQAQLEQENIKHALTTATQLEGELIGYFNSIEQRAFEAARYLTEAGISIYNAKIQAYIAFLESYKAKVEVYRAQIQGELAKVEGYKAEVDAEKAKADVNVAKVQAYRALIEGALANVEVFKAEVQAIVAKAEIEKLKVQTFGEEVRAFSATVNAHTAEVEGYKATVQAEATKQDAFRSKVQAYAAETQANATAIRALVDKYQADISVKNLEWEGYKAASSAAAEKARVIASQNSTLIDAYRGEVAATASYNDVLTKQWQVSIDQAQRVTEIGISAAKANGDFYITARSLALDAAKVGAQVSAQLAAAALNAVNYSLTGSGQASISGSDTTSYNYSL